MTELDYEKKAEEILESVEHIKESIKHIDGVRGAINSIPTIIKAVEEISAKETINSYDKKKLAVTLINKFINIPLMPESIEAIAIGWAVDAAISALNKLIGKDWLAKLS